MFVDPLFIILVLILLLLVAVFLALPVWTFFDAQKNSTTSPPLWALLVFLVPVVGLILYFLLGRDRLE